MRTHESSLPQARTTSIKDQMKYTLCRMVLTNRCLPEPPEHRHGHSSHEKTNHCKEQRSECPGFYVIPLNSVTKDLSSRGGVVELLDTLWGSSCFSLPQPRTGGSGDENHDYHDHPALVEMITMIILI